MVVTKQFQADFDLVCTQAETGQIEIDAMRALIRANPDQWISQITYTANNLGLPSDDINRRIKALIQLEKYWDDYDEIERFELMKKND